jgi:hypothetical protein
MLAAAGHTNVAMTMRYIDSAAVLRSRFGEPHPALPEALAAELELSGLSSIGGETLYLPVLTREVWGDPNGN